MSIRYRVAFTRPEGHLIDVTLRLERPDPAGQRLTLPNWIPGSYMIRDFSRNIVEISARGDAQPLALEKLDKSSWRAPPGLAELELVYRVHAWELSVRAAHVDRSHAFFNGTSVFLRPEGRDDAPVEVLIERPDHPEGERWRVATAMRAAKVDADGFGLYAAQSYDELIDHPFEIGAFTRLAFEAAGVPHEIVLTGHAPFDEARVVADLARVCETQIRLFGEPAPIDRYVFLVQVVDSGYGGLEHRASTALLVGRENLPPPRRPGPDDADGDRPSGGGGRDAAGDGVARDDKYVEFLGLCSHEYFHLWNVKRIRPALFVPYRLDSEVHTRLLWFFEGVTSYYDDLALARAGLITRARYLELLGRTITRVRRGAGRLLQSVTDSSFDAWHKFYKQDANAQNAIVSYYAKGALVALCLDAELRAATAGAASLDTLMRRLWARWLEDGAGLAEDEPERLAAEIAGRELGGFFARALYSTEELPLERALATLGVRLEWRARQGAKDRGGKAGEGDEAAVGPWLGATLAEAPGGAKVVSVASGGPAERAGLAPDDIVIALGGFALGAADIDAALARWVGAKSVSIHHFRLGRLLESRLPIEYPPDDTAILALAEPESPSAWLDGSPGGTSA